MTRLDGKLALVTGASKGIGRAIAERIALDGATVAVHYRGDHASANEAVRAIKDAGGTAFPVQADLISLPDIGKLFEAIDSKYERLDILVNNAGTLFTGSIEETNPGDFDRVVNTNLRGPYFVTKHALRRMGRGGRIVNIASNSTRVAYPEVSVYGLTKAAIQNLTLSLAAQLGPRGITVNALVPGIIDTEMNANWLSPDTVAHVAGLTALGRLGSVTEVANVAAFLVSDEASWVTAQCIEASGGCRL